MANRPPHPLYRSFAEQVREVAKRLRAPWAEKVVELCDDFVFGLAGHNDMLLLWQTSWPTETLPLVYLKESVVGLMILCGWAADAGAADEVADVHGIPIWLRQSEAAL